MGRKAKVIVLLSDKLKHILNNSKCINENAIVEKVYNSIFDLINFD